MVISLGLYSCADYQTVNNKSKKQKKYFYSSGFALVYKESLFDDNIINKKIKNDNIQVMHNLLKTTAIQSHFHLYSCQQQHATYLFGDRDEAKVLDSHVSLHQRLTNI